MGSTMGSNVLGFMVGAAGFEPTTTSPPDLYLRAFGFHFAVQNEGLPTSTASEYLQ